MFAEVLRGQRKRKYEGEFRVVHFSVQANHLHLVVEADSERAQNGGYDALRAGLSGLAIAFARRLNMILRRKGSVWADRYHRHDLKTPREVHRALGYVFGNYTHHGERSYGEGVLDLHSSAWLFDGWDGAHVTFEDAERWRWPVCRARTWLLSLGYRKHGLLKIRPQH
jgi:hypothetical protein